METNSSSGDEVYGGRSPVAVGARLRLMREALGYTQKGFAGLIGVPQNTYNQLERGRNYPSVEITWRIIDVEELSKNMVDMNWVMGGESGGLRHDFAQTIKNLHQMRQRSK